MLVKTKQSPGDSTQEFQTYLRHDVKGPLQEDKGAIKEYVTMMACLQSVAHRWDECLCRVYAVKAWLFLQEFTVWPSPEYKRQQLYPWKWTNISLR